MGVLSTGGKRKVWPKLRPYLVINRLGYVNYRVQKSESAPVVTVHVDHMKVYEHADIPDIWISTCEGVDVGVQVELREI